VVVSATRADEGCSKRKKSGGAGGRGERASSEATLLRALRATERRRFVAHSSSKRKAERKRERKPFLLFFLFFHSLLSPTPSAAIPEDRRCGTLQATESVEQAGGNKVGGRSDEARERERGRKQEGGKATTPPSQPRRTLGSCVCGGGAWGRPAEATLPVRYCVEADDDPALRLWYALATLELSCWLEGAPVSEARPRIFVGKSRYGWKGMSAGNEETGETGGTHPVRVNVRGLRAADEVVAAVTFIAVVGGTRTLAVVVAEATAAGAPLRRSARSRVGVPLTRSAWLASGSGVVGAL
jgi:hypothetical protein